MIKGFLFDLDGTLINTNNLILHTFKHIFKTHMELEVEESEIVKCFGEPLSATFERYSKDNIEFLVNEYKKYNITVHDELAQSYEGVKHTLIQMKEKGYKLAIVTSKRREVAVRGLELFDIFDIMDVIVTPESTKNHKPHEQPVLYACDQLGLNPSEVIMVGDSHNDILSGKNAGALTALVDYTALSIENLKQYKPTYIISHISELFTITEEQDEIS